MRITSAVCILAVVLTFLCISGPQAVFAQDASIDFQQGAILTWDGQFKNMTGVKAYELTDDKPITNWPLWAKALLVGDCVSVAYSGDKANPTAASVMFGRKLGTVSNYLPFIKWDLLDKFDVHFYPLGFYVEKVTESDKTKFKFKGASGLTALSITAKF